MTTAGAQSPAPGVVPVPLPPTYPKATGLALTVNGIPVPVLKVELNRRHREVFDVASFSFSGAASVQVMLDKPPVAPPPPTPDPSAPSRPPKPPEELEILPSGYGIRPQVIGNSFRFALDRPRQILIRIPGRNPLIVFANGPEKSAEPAAGPATLDVVAKYRADPTGKSDSTAAIQRAIDDASVKGGTVLIPPGVFVSQKLTLKNDVRLHLSAGSALRFADRTGEIPDFQKDHPGVYFLSTDGTRNMAVTGPGLIDCNGEKLQGPDSKRRLISAFSAGRVAGLTLDGFTVIDSSSWTIVPAFCERVSIRNIKIVNSLLLYENDGIDPVGCQDVLVDHCFVLATDDTFCPKPGGTGTHGGGVKAKPAAEQRGIVFNDCVGHTRAAGFKLGRQSSVAALNIVFKNSHIISSSRGCAIDHDGGTAPFRNILFQDITVEKLVRLPISIEMVNPGPIRDVTYERVALNVDRCPGSKMTATDDANSVTGVRFIDCSVQGVPVTGPGAPLKLSKNGFIKDVSFLFRDLAKRTPSHALTAVWGTNPVEAPAGQPVPVRPAVLVTDRENRPVAGVEVVFAVESGNGSILQGRAVTGANGVATSGGWTLGKEPGVNTLVASSRSALASHVVFMTTGVSKN